ncbi:MAG: peroxiredoxin family protein [Terriglobales bacterium]
MKRNLLVLAVVVIAVGVMLWTGVRKSRGGGTGDPSGPLTGTVKGKLAPEFELKDLDGNTVRLSDYRGKAVLLNFWATWCPPCKEEMPWFVDLQKEYGPQGLEVLGVAMDDAGRDTIANFIQSMSVNYKILLGTENVADAYGGVQALPTTFCIGRDGKIVSRVFGLVTHREIEENVKTALKQQAPSAGAQTVSQLPLGVQR